MRTIKKIVTIELDNDGYANLLIYLSSNFF